MSLARVRATLENHLRWKAAGEWNLRIRCSAFLLTIGLALLILAGGAYGWMAREQHRLKSTAAQGPQVVEERSANGQLTLLSIPKIGLQAAVLDGTDSRTLLLAPAHLQHTAWPGQPGNSVIAAHRDTFFRRLHDLDEGDDVFVRRGAQEFRYRVFRKTIISPDDVGTIRATPDSRLTLITCYPTYYIGPAPKRLVIVARLEPTGKLAP